MSPEVSSSAASTRPSDFRLNVARLRTPGNGRDLAVEHLEEMARGGNPNGNGAVENYGGVREELHPGWTNEDFQAALDELDRKPTVTTRVREKLALVVDRISN